jgi:uncharacterized membrane protein
VLRATLVGGLLFVAPLILMLVVLQKGVEIAKKVVKPIVAVAPVQSVAGVAMATLAAIVLLVLLALGLGLFAQTRLGQRIREWLESLILGRVPGYAILKGLVGGMDGVEGADVKPVLAWIEESWVYALVLEVHPDGHRTVFVPATPSPLSGAIYFLPEDRLRPIDVPMAEFMKAIRRFGVGSAALVGGRLSPRPPG